MSKEHTHKWDAAKKTCSVCGVAQEQVEFSKVLAAAYDRGTQDGRSGQEFAKGLMKYNDPDVMHSYATAYERAELERKQAEEEKVET